ncbi:hypothetical protein [Oceanivirga miroungae]|uniref:MORN repeat-containing protein n=1 Tax=Oceanivirga miroungae TaxID=1130046 RepID=A0A6I8M6L7_9FUSO|nr:hypothetical protein [Oceanivirga miroungae]VWL85096.1 hypothetical protein OMES3154_00378 [Oceanivirga miroungae]
MKRFLKVFIGLALISNLGFAEVKLMKYENGSKEEVNYVKGKREGKYIEYYANGDVEKDTYEE